MSIVAFKDGEFTLGVVKWKLSTDRPLAQCKTHLHAPILSAILLVKMCTILYVLFLQAKWKIKSVREKLMRESFKSTLMVL